MKNQTVRVVLFLVAIVFAAGAMYFIIAAEQRLGVQRAGERAVRDQSAALLALISDLRAGQRSYVAIGQGHDFWMARVTTLLTTAQSKVSGLAGVLRAEPARTSLDAAAVALENFSKLDARAQEHVSLNQLSAASDLIFSDGMELMEVAASAVESAQSQELKAHEADSAALRQRQAWIGAVGLVALVIATMLLVPIPTPQDASVPARAMGATETSAPTDAKPQPVAPVDPGLAPDLAETARLCIELGRVMQTSEVPPLLAHAATLLDAAGLVVWVSDRTGSELKPVFTHGYSDKIVATMSNMSRDAQNATALAFRSAQPRAVTSTNQTHGAFVVPLITPAGCVGVFAAELRHGSEQRESTRALTMILGAQLATLVAAAPASGTAAAQA
jgi:CHASE3 domain sensor protein